MSAGSAVGRGAADEPIARVNQVEAGAVEDNELTEEPRLADLAPALEAAQEAGERDGHRADVHAAEPRLPGEGAILAAALAAAAALGVRARAVAARAKDQRFGAVDPKPVPRRWGAAVLMFLGVLVLVLAVGIAEQEVGALGWLTILPDGTAQEAAWVALSFTVITSSLAWIVAHVVHAALPGLLRAFAAVLVGVWVLLVGSTVAGIAWAIGGGARAVPMGGFSGGGSAEDVRAVEHDINWPLVLAYFLLLATAMYTVFLLHLVEETVKARSKADGAAAAIGDARARSWTPVQRMESTIALLQAHLDLYEECVRRGRAIVGHYVKGALSTMPGAIQTPWRRSTSLLDPAFQVPSWVGEIEGVVLSLQAELADARRQAHDDALAAERALPAS